MEHVLFQILIYLGATVIAVPLAARLGLRSVLGYLAAGISIGRILDLVGSETKDVQSKAEFGIVMLLFMIGLSLKPRALWDLPYRLLGLGSLQLAVTAGAIMLCVMALGFSAQIGLVIGFILALSSTAIVLQTLTKRGLIKSHGGQSIFAVLLTQDIAVIPILAALPLFAVQRVSLRQDASISDLKPRLGWMQRQQSGSHTLTRTGSSFPCLTACLAGG